MTSAGNKVHGIGVSVVLAACRKAKTAYHFMTEAVNQPYEMNSLTGAALSGWSSFFQNCSFAQIGTNAVESGTPFSIFRKFREVLENGRGQKAISSAKPSRSAWRELLGSEKLLLNTPVDGCGGLLSA